MKPCIPQLPSIPDPSSSQEALVNNWKSLPPQIKYRTVSHTHAAQKFAKKEQLKQTQQRRVQKSIKKATSVLHKSNKKDQKTTPPPDNKADNALLPGQADESLSLGLEDIFDTKFWKEDMGDFDLVLDQIQQEPLNQNFRNRP